MLIARRPGVNFAGAKLTPCGRNKIDPPNPLSGLRAEPKSRLYATETLSAENRSVAAAQNAFPPYSRDFGYQRLCGSGG
jgi:hypothetical protein